MAKLNEDKSQNSKAKANESSSDDSTKRQFVTFDWDYAKSWLPTKKGIKSGLNTTFGWIPGAYKKGITNLKENKINYTIGTAAIATMLVGWYFGPDWIDNHKQNKASRLAEQEKTIVLGDTLTIDDTLPLKDEVDKYSITNNITNNFYLTLNGDTSLLDSNNRFVQLYFNAPLNVIATDSAKVETNVEVKTIVDNSKNTNYDSQKQQKTDSNKNGSRKKKPVVKENITTIVDKETSSLEDALENTSVIDSLPYYGNKKIINEFQKAHNYNMKYDRKQNRQLYKNNAKQYVSNKVFGKRKNKNN